MTMKAYVCSYMHYKCKKLITVQKEVYTCHCNVVIILVRLKENLMKLCRLRRSDNCVIEIPLLNIPECTYNYHKYQDELISDDFK